MKDEISKLHQLLLDENSINLLEFKVSEPVKQEQFDEPLLVSLSAKMRRFYECSNGLRVLWHRKAALLPDRTNRSLKIKSGDDDWMWPSVDYWGIDGVINILPIEYLQKQAEHYRDFLWTDEDEKYEINWKGSSMNQLKFLLKIRPFDLYAKDESVFLHTTEEEKPLLIGDDHYIDFESYGSVSFETYFDHLINTKGEVNLRKSLFEKS